MKRSDLPPKPDNCVRVVYTSDTHDCHRELGGKWHDVPWRDSIAMRVSPSECTMYAYTAPPTSHFVRGRPTSLPRPRAFVVPLFTTATFDDPQYSNAAG